MADFFGWVGDVMSIEFVIGAVTVTLGYIIGASFVFGVAVRNLKKIR